MKCPSYNQLPGPPNGKVGWPWIINENDAQKWTVDPIRLPKITIITPSLNQGMYLEETIRSVLLQGYPNLEYIIIDGGSTDGSVDIIRKYEPWISYWISEPDKGQSDAINKGARQATGTLMNWLNSDDLYLPGAIWEIADAHKRYPEHLIAGHTIIYNEKDGKEEVVYQPSDINLTMFIQYWSIARRIWSGQPCWFFPTSAFKDSGYLDTSLHYAMDRDILIKMWRNRSVTVIDAIIVKFRVHDDAKTTAFHLDAIAESMLVVHARYLNLLKNNDRRNYIKTCLRLLLRTLPGRIKRGQIKLFVNIVVGGWRLGVRYFIP